MMLRRRKTNNNKICLFFSDYLADQDSFELVKLNPTVEPPLHGPIPRFKQPAIDGMSRLISFLF
jgi:hypothetical protein